MKKKSKKKERMKIKRTLAYTLHNVFHRLLCVLRREKEKKKKLISSQWSLYD